MDKEIIIALIGACGVVLAAIITGLFTFFNKEDSKSRKTVVNQKQKGCNNTQIGIQNNYKAGDKDNE